MRQVEQELDRLRRAGEPTRLPDLLPPIPPSQDGTPFYREAIWKLEVAEAELPYPVWDNLGEFVSRQPTQSIIPADVEKMLKTAKPALATLHKALTYLHMRLTNWKVGDPFSVLFPHFVQFRKFARLLIVEAYWRKRRGDVNGAIENCLVTLRLARRMGEEPSLVTFLAQGSIFVAGMRAVQWVLEDTDASSGKYRGTVAGVESVGH